MNTPKFLESIALGLPGGGYRAAGFSLGILSFLNKVGLLPNVKAISTVSGGTITGVKFAEMMARGKSFETFLSELKEWLEKDSLLQDGLRKLNNGDIATHKRQNLINAFASVYDDMVPMTFAELEKGLEDHADLEEVIFNSTDFKHGLPFRFSSSGRFGNGKGSFSNLKSQVRLGDIIAASSCFPGAFEPINFPNDFVANHQETISVPLMDGGIMDNQGTSSYVTTGKLKHDTYLIADVGQEQIDGFEYAEDSKTTRYISNLFSPWVLIFFVAVSVALYFIDAKILAYLGSIIVVILICMQVGLQVALNYATRKLGLKTKVSIPRRKIGLFLIDRLNSLSLLNMSIFLKGAKSRNISNIYEINRTSTSKLSIYEFILDEAGEKPVNISNWERIRQYTGDISQDLQDLSYRMSRFGTTLWFPADEAEKKKIIDDLIRCGEAVCCFNLMTHMIKNIASDEDLKKSQLFRRLFDEWGTYNNGNVVVIWP